MKITKQRVYLESDINGEAVLNAIERYGRTCYKSEDKITGTSSSQFVRNIIKRGHESVIEHVSVTVRITTNRAISHELVRHRIASYSQESTRYVDYDEMEFIAPHNLDDESYRRWLILCTELEAEYKSMRERGVKPEVARDILPNCLKTELVMTTNLREWRHIIKMRISKQAHPQVREIAMMLLEMFSCVITVVFDDIVEEVGRDGNQTV